MVPRLWVPLTHWLWARNWKLAASGACLTASRVANRVAVSTPLRIESLTSAVVSVVVIVARLPGGGLTGDGGGWGLVGPGSGRWPPSGRRCRSGGCEQAGAWEGGGGGG